MKQLFLIISILSFQYYSAQTEYVHLISKMNGVHSLSNGDFTNIWGYGYWDPTPVITLPAPLLIFNEGDSIELEMTNDSPEAHTIHLHGLDVDQVNDGVPQTSFQVIQGESATYRFKADQPGTFLYHCHVTTTLHLTMGMYGMIVIERDDNTLFEGGPSYDQSYYFLCSDLEVETNNFPTIAFPYHEIQPDYFMVNGLSDEMLFNDASQVIQSTSGESIALRLCNTAYAKTQFVFPSGSNPSIYMSDGRALANFITNDTLEIYPGERFSVIVEPEDGLEDYIEVKYFSMENGEYQATNYIGINQFSYPTSVFESEGDLPLLLYPNPTDDFIYIKGSTIATIESIEIMDITGRIELARYNLTEFDKIDLSGLPSGTYIARINGHLSKKFIKF